MIMKKKNNIKTIGIFIVILFFCFFNYDSVLAANLQDLIDQNIINEQMIEDWLIGGDQPVFGLTLGGESVEASSTIQLIFIFVLIALAPTLLIMLTSFTRIIIVMHFLRSALGTQQMPPNQILIGLALFLTFFIMGPIFARINEEAFVPYSYGQITQAQVVEIGMEPIRQFMINNVRLTDLAFFAGLAGESFETPEDIPFRVLIPAFILTELTIGFIIGFIIFVPFIVIDMVVSSVLMAMGMMMLPPAMISTPFKILLFILVDGWTLLIGELVRTFNF